MTLLVALILSFLISHPNYLQGDQYCSKCSEGTHLRESSLVTGSDDDGRHHVRNSRRITVCWVITATLVTLSAIVIVIAIVIAVGLLHQRRQSLMTVILITTDTFRRCLIVDATPHSPLAHAHTHTQSHHSSIAPQLNVHPSPPLNHWPQSLTPTYFPIPFALSPTHSSLHFHDHKHTLT